jgi:hypothetical protein
VMRPGNPGRRPVTMRFTWPQQTTHASNTKSTFIWGGMRRSVYAPTDAVSGRGCSPFI